MKAIFKAIKIMNITESGLKLAHEQGLAVSIANTIMDAGKFAGEHVSTLYFYELFLNGFYDEDTEDMNTVLFKLTDEDKKHLQTDFKYFVLMIQENGFVVGDYSNVKGNSK